jgi:hypothetical protein
LAGFEASNGNLISPLYWCSNGCSNPAEIWEPKPESARYPSPTNIGLLAWLLTTSEPLPQHSSPKHRPGGKLPHDGIGLNDYAFLTCSELASSASKAIGMKSNNELRELVRFDGAEPAL